MEINKALVGEEDFNKLLKAIEKYNTSVRKFLDPENYDDFWEKQDIQEKRAIREINVIENILAVELLFPGFTTTTEYSSKEAMLDQLAELKGFLDNLEEKRGK